MGEVHYADEIIEWFPDRVIVCSPRRQLGVDDNEPETTTDPSKVTCRNCRRTKAWKEGRDENA